MFAAWSRMRKLEEATNGKDEPAPIYLLDEIFQEAQQGIQEVGPIVEFCLKRLTARPAIVKQKTLRLIKHLCNKGANEFRRAMARHSSAVKEMTHYKGEPDPLKGDVPNQRVRDAAREALDALFGADSGYASTAAPAPQLTNRIQGFGSTNYSAGGSSNSFGGGSGGGTGAHSSRLGVGAAEGIIGSGLALGQAAYNMAAEAASSVTAGTKSSGAGSGSGMQGFGNPRYESGAGRAPNYAPPATGSGGSGSSSNTGYGGRSSPAAVSTSQRWGSSVAGAAGSAISGASNAISGALSPTHRSRGSESMLGDQAGDGYNSDDHGQSGHRQAAALSSTATHRSSAPGVSAAGSARDVVDRLCAAGGVRAQPGAEELRTFVDTIRELDGLEVGSLLAEKMEGTSWQAALRSLCALEAIVQQGSSAACGEAAVFFQSDPSALHAASQSPQATVRTRARRVLTAIGAETLPDAASHNSAPAAAPPVAAAEAEPDLLGGLGDDGPAAAPPHTEHNQNGWQDTGAYQQQQQQPPAAAAPEEDLLDLMGGGEDVTQPQLQTPLQQQQHGGMFSGLDLASARSGTSPVASQAPSAGSDMFGGLSLADSGAADTALQHPPSSHPQHVRPPADELADLFTSLAAPDSGGAVSQHSWGQAAAKAPQQANHSASNGSALSAVQMGQPTTAIVGGSGNFSGKGSVFDDLDAETRRNRPSMGAPSPKNDLATSAYGPSAGVSPQQQWQPGQLYGAVMPQPQYGQPQYGQPHGVPPQLGQHRQAPGQPLQYGQGQAQHPQASYGQGYGHGQAPAAPLQGLYSQPQQQPQQQQQWLGFVQQPPQLSPSLSLGAGGGSGGFPIHQRTHSGLGGSSPTAARARETLQQMGVPDGFAPVRPEQQEAAFDFVGLHINQLKK